MLHTGHRSLVLHSGVPERQSSASVLQLDLVNGSTRVWRGYALLHVSCSAALQVGATEHKRERYRDELRWRLPLRGCVGASRHKERSEMGGRTLEMRQARHHLSSRWESRHDHAFEVRVVFCWKGGF